MPHSEIVVALDVGATKVCALVGEVSGEDQIEILGVGSAPSAGIRRGVVTDISATTAGIREAVTAAERMAGVHVATVYVNLTGEHLQSRNNRGQVAVTSEVADEHVHQARLAARQILLPSDREILHNLVRQFIVDGEGGVKHPVGMAASRLEVETHMVTAATTFVENIVKCVERAHLEIDEIVVGPLAAGLAVLTDAEKQLGVAMADIGGGTTDMAIFLDGSIAHSQVLPVGGIDVTNDLALGFRLDPIQAEEVKLRHGTALASSCGVHDYIEIHMIGEQAPREIPRRLLPEIIHPRMLDLFKSMRAALEASEIGLGPVRTVVLTGGGSQLHGAAEVAQAVLGLPVRVGRPRDLMDVRGLAAGPEHAVSAGMLHYAARRMAGRRAQSRQPSLPSAALRRMASWVRRLRRADLLQPRA